jgi:hypothetical protein
MKIAITSNGAFIDQRDGSLVEGRLSVYLRDSDDLATTYTLEGNEFVQAENPVLLHSGLSDNTLFADAGIYRLKVEKYTGPQGQMSVDADPAYFEQVDIYEVGFDWDSAVTNAQNVDSIEDLRSVDPSVGSVNVLSYYSIGDCSPRTYVWDAGSVDAIDGGYVVGSDVSDTGRWILLWGDEILPCTAYGVYAGSEANLNALLQYPRLVGSFSLVTAPCVRFTRGEYTSNTSFVTDKEIVMDGDAKFTLATIQCPKVRVLGSRSSYVGNFVFTSPDAEAHSSWFRTLQGFWKCDASVLYIDGTNYFVSNTLVGNVNLGNKKIVGSTHLDAVFGANAFYTVSQTTAVMGRIFNGNDYVKVSGHGDELWLTSGSWDPGLISAGHHQEWQNTPDLDLFENADRWVETMVERRTRITNMGDTLDLQNRKVGNVNAGLFTTIKNLYTDRLTVSNPTATIVLEKVQTPEVIAACSTLYIDGSDVSFKYEPSVTYFTGRNSYISVSGVAWRSMAMHVSLTDCQIEGMDFRKETDNEDYGGGISLTDCILHNCKFYAKAMHLFGCNVSQSEIRFLPYFNDGEYHINPKLVGNRFNTNTPVLFTKAIESEDCYNCVLTAEITGNTFNGNADGIECRYWSDRTGINYTRTFIKESTGNSIVYSGNSGLCPKESGKGMLIGDNTDYVQKDVGGINVYAYKNTRSVDSRNSASCVLSGIAAIPRANPTRWLNGSSTKPRCPCSCSLLATTWWPTTTASPTAPILTSARLRWVASSR